MSRVRRLLAGAMMVAAGLLVAAPAHAAVDGVLKETSCIDDAAINPGGTCADVSPMNGIGQIAISPDGKNVYVPSRASNSIDVFDRNADGSLTQKAGAAGCRTAAAAVGVCDHNNVDNGLTNAIAAAVSPDGNHVYVVGQTGNSIVTYTRNSDGSLTPGNCYVASGSPPTGCDGGYTTLAGPVAVAATNDTVYVASAGSGGVQGDVSAFTVSGSQLLKKADANGYVLCYGATLVPAGCNGSLPNNIASPRDVAVSPDGNQVYISDDVTAQVVAFDINKTGGNVGQIEARAFPGGCVSPTSGNPNCSQLANLHQADQLSFSPDGSRLYVTSRASPYFVAAIDRAANGDITVHSPNPCVGGPAGACTGGIGFAEPFDVVATPDGQHVYAGALNNDAITLLSNAAGATPFAQAPAPFGCYIPGGASGQCRDLPNGSNPGRSGIESMAVSPDSHFLYATVGDGNGDRILTLAIDHAPVCAPVGASTPYATAVTVQLACADPDGDPITFEKLSDPAKGTLGALQPNGTITYAPFAGTSGTDSFTFAATAAGVPADPQTVTITVGAPPPAPPPVKPPPRRIHLSTLGGWTVSNRGVRINKMVLHGLKKGDKVKLTCSSCHVKQTLTAKGSSLSLTKLKHKVLKRRKGFTVIATATGAIGDELTLTVKKYGHKHRDIVRESNAPFTTKHRCLPVGSSKPQKTC